MKTGTIGATLTVVFILTLFVPGELSARGFRGGGGGMRGGGGFSRPSMGGGSPSFSRPSPSRSSSFSRPSQPVRSGSSYSRSSRPSTASRSSSLGSRSPGSVNFSRSSTAGTRLGSRQIGSSRVGDRQIGGVDRTPGGRVGDRQLGAVDRTPGGRVGDRQLGAIDRTPGNRAGDRQLGGVDRTPRDIGSRAVIPGLAAGAGGAAVGSRLSGNLQSQLSSRRSQFQQNRADGAVGERAQSRYENRDQMVADRRENLQGRMEGRQDNIGERQENRDGAREDRQDYRDQAREDWQDWADNNHWDDHWDNDNWHDDLQDHWDYMWDNYPVYSALRVTAWGVNRASYLFGSGGYENPYYEGGGGGYDYSEPLVSDAPMEAYIPADAAADPAAAPAPPGVPPEAVAHFDQARAEFKQRNYEGALQAVDAAIALLPKDAALHEFRSLALFALGRYKESAEAIYAVLAVGPGWNWTTMSALYGDVADYTVQLKALEEYVRNNSTSADCRLLLAYHYLTCGHRDAAKRQFESVLKLQPKDTVAADMVQMLGGTVPAATSPPPPAAPSGPKAKEADLIGSWAARQSSGESFELTLTKEGEFKWNYSSGSKKQEIRGVFAVDDGVLAMQPDSGGVMAANVNLTADKGFTFSQLGNPESKLIVFQRK